MGKKVLISGASVAGPALAYWLGRHGFDVTVVEVAPDLREGGQAVDFRGDTHLTVLERMGVLDDLRRIQTGGTPMVCVDEKGRTRLRLPADFAGGDIEVLRGDLARVLFEHSLPYAEYLFGDSIAGLRQDTGGVHVRFRSGRAGTFDLVVGADGIHSHVRRLAFGPEEEYLSHLGYYAATWSLPNYPGIGFGEGSVGVNVPGRYASVGTDNRDRGTAHAFFLFAAGRLAYDRHDPEQQKALITEAFAGIGWDVPHLLETLKETDELYFDSISRADVPSWSNGRVTLIGDAACGATIGGMGTGTAVVAAYVLAGELAAAGGDHVTAFARYEALLRDYAQGCQRGGDRTGKFLAPGRLGLPVRNWLLRRRRVLDWMLAEGKKATHLELPDYGQRGTVPTGQCARTA
ncbi:FAD-dependent oxidoreductase [Streptomyces cinnamoneus]|uniref:FAD-dependent oxidoreductase n=1 Tax=Streptomyces cinnamoneus TaxID=53446 RepID=A0A2G1XGU8_STRCJ|nr:FAD-dependent monooxygenase [Streptomyces cinnamoneus]PHQ50468.1 FAD-dependent oxidoreductase [Streptomyces cinnamoneus]PPT14277.1 FAD-dependent oxidoreductase [Streptomyces cinnamoneus]